MYSDNDTELSFIVENKDYSDIKWSVYNANTGKDEGPDYGIDKGYIKDHAQDIWERHRWDVDLVMFLVHDDSWNDSGDGIWGWNLANAHKGYEIEQVRWDPKNSANTVGTIYHEIAHSHDSFIYRNLGVWIEGIVGVSDWDRDMVHGNGHQFDYIQYNENLEAIKKISTYLNQSSLKRRALQDERRSMQKRIISLARQAIDLYRELGIYVKKEDKKIYKSCIKY